MREPASSGSSGGPTSVTSPSTVAGSVSWNLTFTSVRCAAMSTFCGRSAFISTAPASFASPLFSLQRRSSMISASCVNETLPFSSRAAMGNPRRRASPPSMRRFPSMVGFCNVPPTVAWTRYLPAACSRSEKSPWRIRPSMEACMRRSSFPPRKRLPETVTVVYGARSASLLTSMPAGPKMS